MTEENKNSFKSLKFRNFYDKRNKKTFTSILSKRAPPKLNLNLNMNDSSESNNNNQNNINTRNSNNFPSSYRFISRNNNISNYNSLNTQRNELFSPLSSRLKPSLKSFQTSKILDYNITNDSNYNLIIDKNQFENLLKGQREEKKIVNTEANRTKFSYKKITKQKSLTNYSNQINIDNIDDQIESMGKEIQEAEDQKNTFLTAFDNLKDSGISGDLELEYTSYVENAKRNYYYVKEKAILIDCNPGKFYGALRAKLNWSGGPLA